MNLLDNRPEQFEKITRLNLDFIEKEKWIMYNVTDGYTQETTSYKDLYIAFSKFFDNVTEDEDVYLDIDAFIELGLLTKNIISTYETQININICGHKLFEVG